jgi:hypothetical protein
MLESGSADMNHARTIHMLPGFTLQIDRQAINDLHMKIRVKLAYKFLIFGLDCDESWEKRKTFMQKKTSEMENSLKTHPKRNDKTHI